MHACRVTRKAVRMYGNHGSFWPKRIFTYVPRTEEKLQRAIATHERSLRRYVKLICRQWRIHPVRLGGGAISVIQGNTKKTVIT